MIEESGLDEPFDWLNTKYIVLGYKEGEPVAVVSYGISEIHHKVLPRFLHIIISKKYQHCISGYKVLVESEQILKKKGYKQLVACFVPDLPGKEMKMKYARKFGYKQFCTVEDGTEWLYKDIH
jgi:hypothetical protein